MNFQATSPKNRNKIFKLNSSLLISKCSVYIDSNSNHLKIHSLSQIIPLSKFKPRKKKHLSFEPVDSRVINKSIVVSNKQNCEATKHDLKLKKSSIKCFENKEKENFLWKKLRNVVLTIVGFNRPTIKHIKEEGDLNDEFQGNNPDIIYNGNRRHDELKKMKDKKRFFTILENGDIKDIEWFLNYLENDPKRFLYNHDDPLRLANEYNENFQTPLYVACKHNNIKYVQLLLQNKANPHIISKIGKKIEENLLSLVARKKYSELFSVLIDQIQWTSQEIKQAIKIAAKAEIKNKLQSLLHHQKTSVLHKFSKMFKNSCSLLCCK